MINLSDMRSRIAKLVPYARRTRPPAPDSFPPFVEAELRRIDTSSREIVQVIKDLNERVTALEG